jgi:hypothetical protein
MTRLKIKDQDQEEEIMIILENHKMASSKEKMISQAPL